MARKTTELNKSTVTVFCFLLREDAEISALIKTRFENEGINVLVNHRAKQVRQKDNKDYLIVEHEEQDKEIEFDALIVAVGRAACSRGFGLEELGVQLNPDNTIEVNEYLQSNIPTIYACGDAAGPYQFTHVAAHQAWFALVNSLFGGFKPKGRLKETRPFIRQWVGRSTSKYHPGP